MTKLLYIPAGQYITFQTSFEFDLRYPKERRTTEIFEDSFSYLSKGRTIQQHLLILLNKEKIRLFGPEVNTNIIQYPALESDFEVIYD